MQVGDVFIDYETGTRCEVVWTGDMALVTPSMRVWKAGSSLGLPSTGHRAPRWSAPGSRGAFGRVITPKRYDESAL